MPTLNELFRPFRAGTDAVAANSALEPERLRAVVAAALVEARRDDVLAVEVDVLARQPEAGARGGAGQEDAEGEEGGGELHLGCDGRVLLQAEDEELS